MRPIYWLLPYLLHTLALPVEPPHINNSLQSNAILRRLSLDPDYAILPREEPPLGQKKPTSILKDTNRPVDHVPEKKTVRFATSPEVKEFTPDDKTPSPPPPPVPQRRVGQRSGQSLNGPPPTLHRSQNDHYNLAPDGRPSKFF
ncbi:hypothetical protein H0H93_000655 [Arthromyces matolae]|nr:hypothetical protein H0H93_000655 [Arthromyces matolae]